MEKDLYSTLVLTEREFSKDLWNKVGEALSILTQAGYICVLRQEDFSTIIIEYNYENEEYGCPRPVWLTYEEQDQVDSIRCAADMDDDEVEDGV